MFYFNEAWFGNFKKMRGKCYWKMALNGWMSFVENFLKNLGINLKSFEACVFLKIRQKLKA